MEYLYRKQRKVRKVRKVRKDGISVLEARESKGRWNICAEKAGKYGKKEQLYKKPDKVEL